MGLCRALQMKGVLSTRQAGEEFLIGTHVWIKKPYADCAGTVSFAVA